MNRPGSRAYPVSCPAVTPIRDYHWQPVAELLSRGWSNDIVIQLARTRQLLDPIDHPTVRSFNNALAAAIRDRLGRDAEPVLTAQERTATRPLWTRPRLVMDLTAEGRA